MKHFLRITCNVFVYHAGTIRFCFFINLLLGILFYLMDKDKTSLVLCPIIGILVSVSIGYYEEVKRFKEKGHY